LLPGGDGFPHGAGQFSALMFGEDQNRVGHEEKYEG
jgi:hypothetical protein